MNSMIIDGYSPPDPAIAQEQGVEFLYELPFGSITIRSKMAGRENTKFRLAMQNHQQWAERRKNLGNSVDKAAEEKFTALVHDTLVLSWSTTIKSDGKEIAPTRENFVSLMTSQACSKVLSIYLSDAGDEEHFRALTAEEVSENLPKRSAGSSSGPTSESGSEK